MPCHTVSQYPHVFMYTCLYMAHSTNSNSTLVHIQTHMPSTHTHILRHIYYITLIHSHIHRYVSLYMYRQTFTSFTPSRHTDTHPKYILILVFLAGSIVVSQFSTHYTTRILQIQVSPRYFNHLPIHS